MRYWLSIGTFQLFGRFPVYGVVGVCLYRIHERQSSSCKCLYSGVNSHVGILNVVGIHEPLHE